MSSDSFLNKILSFFGIWQNDKLRTDFRNPIWSTEDDEEVDELYQSPEGSHSQLNIYSDPLELHRQMTRQMQELFKSFSSLFGDDRSFFSEDNIGPYDNMDSDDPEKLPESNIREYYLKPGYRNHYEEFHKEDVDLDGKISSDDISGLLKKRDEFSKYDPVFSFKGNVFTPEKSFFQTTITTSITKPDGTIETRRIVKNEKGIVEETTTCTIPKIPNDI